MFWRQRLSWSRHFQALFVISGLDESAFINWASLIAHEHRSPLTPDTGPRLHHLEGPGCGHSSVWGKGQGSSPAPQGPGRMRLPCLRAQLRGSCETQPREAGSTYWVQVRPTFLPRLLSSLTLSRPLLPSGCPAGLLGRDRPPRATLTRPPPGAPCSRRGCSQGHLVKVREPAS